jgi:hypothetical protein
LSSSQHHIRTYRWKYLELIKDGLIWLTGKRTRGAAKATESSNSVLAVAAKCKKKPMDKKLMRMMRKGPWRYPSKGADGRYLKRMMVKGKPNSKGGKVVKYRGGSKLIKGKKDVKGKGKWNNKKMQKPKPGQGKGKGNAPKYIRVRYVSAMRGKAKPPARRGAVKKPQKGGGRSPRCKYGPGKGSGRPARNRPNRPPARPRMKNATSMKGGRARGMGVKQLTMLRQRKPAPTRQNPPRRAKSKLQLSRNINNNQPTVSTHCAWRLMVMCFYYRTQKKSPLAHRHYRHHNHFTYSSASSSS